MRSVEMRFCFSIKGQTGLISIPKVGQNWAATSTLEYASMASSTSSGRSRKKLKPRSSNDDSEEWLDLGLGQSPQKNPMPPAASNPTATTPSEPELGLGQIDEDGGTDDEFLATRRMRLASRNRHQAKTRENSSSSSSLQSPPSGGSSLSSANIYVGEQPNPGLWFGFRAIDSSDGDDKALPQVQKSYIRVKEEKMKISVVKKYLARKLGLDNADEVAISCMGQKVFDSQTLQYVRDEIWRPLVIESLAARKPVNFANSDHVLMLEYGRRRSED